MDHRLGVTAALAAAVVAVLALGAVRAKPPAVEKTPAAIGKKPLPDAPAADTARLSPVRVLGDGRFRHAASLTHIVPLSDGKRILTSARDGTARLWDLATGRELQRYPHPDGEDVWNVQVLPGETQLLTCGEDQHVTRWDLATGKQLKRYKQGTTLLRMAVCDQGRRVIATGSNKKIVQWNLETGERIHSLTGHTSSVYGVSVMPGAMRAVTCGSDNSLRLWDLASGTAGLLVKGHGATVHTVAHSPDGRWIASAGDDNTVRLWHADGESRWKADLPDGAFVVAWSPDGEHLAVTCDDRNVYTLSAATGKQELKIPLPGERHWPVAYSTDGKEIFSGGDQLVYRWDAATGARKFPAAGEKYLRGAVKAVSPGPSGSLLVCGDDAHVHAWDRESGAALRNWRLPAAASFVQLSPRGSRMLAAGGTVVWVLDVESGKTLLTLTHAGSVSGAAFALGGKRVVTVGNKSVIVWDANSGGRVSTLAQGEHAVNHLRVLSDDQHFATLSADKTARIWSAESGSLVAQLSNAGQAFSGCAFSRDDRAMMAIGGDHKLYCWIAPLQPDVRSTASEKLEQLVGLLGSPRFAEREESLRALIRAGHASLPHLARADVSDPEVAWRVQRARQGIAKVNVPSQRVAQTLALGNRIGDVAFHPDGRRWAATVRTDGLAEVVLGELNDAGPRILARASDGRSPRRLLFDPAGTHLHAANRDGTVSVYRVE